MNDTPKESGLYKPCEKLIYRTLAEYVYWSLGGLFARVESRFAFTISESVEDEDDDSEITELLTRIAEAWGFDEPVTPEMVRDGIDLWNTGPRAECTKIPLYQWLSRYFVGIRTRAVLAGWVSNKRDPGREGYAPDEGV